MNPREQSSSGTPAKRDHRQEVTDAIVKMLEGCSSHGHWDVARV